MSKYLKKYILTLSILAVLCYYFAYKLSYTFYNNTLVPVTFLNVIIFVILSLIAESSLFVHNHVGISTGFMITTASLLCFNLLWAMIIVGLGCSFRIITTENKTKMHIFNTPIEKTLFNISTYSVSIFVAGAFALVTGNNNSDLVVILFIKFIIFVFVFLTVNAFFISLLMSILRGESVHKIYMFNIKMGFLSVVFIAPLGIIFSYFYYKFSIAGAAMFVIPLLLLKYIFEIYV